MKLSLLLTTLLLSASPVVADDFLYMVCKYGANMKATELPSGKTTENQFEGEFILFKVDLLNKKLRNHVDPRWADVTVEGDQIIQDTKLTLGDTTAETYTLFPLTFPGPISMQDQWRDPSQLIVVNAQGECREIDSFTWDEAVESVGKKQPSIELQNTEGLEKFR